MIKLTPERFEAALERLAWQVNEVKGPSCLCRFENRLRRVKHHVLKQLYGIAQEAVHNALKHARAKTIWIRVRRVKGRAQLSIEDDGVGVRSAPGRIGMGFSNMRVRARSIGARLAIRRGKAGGTEVVCELGSKQ